MEGREDGKCERWTVKGMGGFLEIAVRGGSLSQEG